MNKPPGEVKRILDLKNIDLQKRLDLTKYEIFRVRNSSINCTILVEDFKDMNLNLLGLHVEFQKQDRILEITKIMEDILMETDQDNVKRFAAPIRKVSLKICAFLHGVNPTRFQLQLFRWRS